MPMKKFRSVDHFMDEAEFFTKELTRLRTILQSMDLEETLKWSFPCYCHQGKNVVGIGAFKSYFGLWFFQGALLADQDRLLINAQEGKTKAMRQWRMTSAKEIKTRTIKRYVLEAIQLVESGKEIKPERNKSVEIDPLMQQALAKNQKAAKQFATMRPGCQREYANYIIDAKREETKRRRIEKILPMIVAGGGLNDRYRK